MRKKRDNMNTKSVWTFGVWLGLTLAGAAQSSFQNLDFEAAHGPFAFNPDWPKLATSEALPDWSAREGNFADFGYVGYRVTAIPGPNISLLDAYTPSPVLRGNYLVGMSTGRGGPSAYWVPVWIAQTGTIPAEAFELSFLSQSGTGAANLAVTFGGTLLPFQPVEDVGAGAERYAADVSALAGTTAELRFTTLLLASGNNYVELDNIQFSTIPEPSPVLLLLGGMAIRLMARRRTVVSRRLLCDAGAATSGSPPFRRREQVRA
jgi:hypothetical protein